MCMNGGRVRGRGRGRGTSRLHAEWDPDTGLDPETMRTLRPLPEPKSDTQLTAHPGTPPPTF